MRLLAEGEHISSNFPIIGIGAANGGLKAIKDLVNAILPVTGMSYVIATHKAIEYDDMAGMLSGCTALPVTEIMSDVLFQPDHIYVIPQNHTLIESDGHLKLYRMTRGDNHQMPIDIFFESLSQVHKSFAVGVILSGQTFDGTVGLKKIKEAGGATIAQDPDTAQYPEMPRNAIAVYGGADYVLHPNKIPDALIRIRESFQSSHSYLEEELISESDANTFNQILLMVRATTGRDYTAYRQTTIRRRIARRMVINTIDSLLEYLNFLKINPTEQNVLADSCIIPVTYFFRDKPVFKFFSTTIVPEMVKNATNKKIRIWVAGCSTGEEAYSLAICFHEYITANSSDVSVQIFASDLSEELIKKARKATYSQQDVQDISPERLEKYFSKKDGTFQGREAIRKMCVFAVHNVAVDQPFGKIDLIACRNVLIYLNESLQLRVLQTFSNALNENGIFILGLPETPDSNHFEPIARNIRIYKKRGGYATNLKTVSKPISTYLPALRSWTTKTGIEKSAQQLFLRYAPAGIIIDENYNIIHFHGDTSAFLSFSEGKPDNNLFKMVRSEIDIELRGAILNANGGQSSLKENIQVAGAEETITIEVHPTGDDKKLLVLFRKTGTVTTADRLTSDEKVQKLESEMQQWRENMRRITEEREIAYEELHIANEELLSSAEEMQIVNEELATSADELQSKNEELSHTAQELMDRHDQLELLKHYSEAIINTIHEPLLLLDDNFQVTSANHAFHKFSETTNSEIFGRSIFAYNWFEWDQEEAKDLLKAVINGNAIINDYPVSGNAASFGNRLMLMTARIVNDVYPISLLLTFKDITEESKAKQLTELKIQELQAINDELRKFTASASHDLQEPLRKTLMFAQRILDSDENFSENNRNALERITVAISHMQNLISNLIAYSELTLSTSVPKRFNMNLVLKRAFEEVKAEAKSRGAEFKLGHIPELKIIPGQMKEVFVGLFSNALLYCISGQTPLIEVSSKVAKAADLKTLGIHNDSVYLKITVSDNGEGFSESHAERIFEPFFRLYSKDIVPGSGLGLTICKKIIRNHNGFIIAESMIGNGAKFHLYLPVE